jgi:hypothetical protein
MMEDFGAAHERHLAAYRTSRAEVWCRNPKCDNHTGPTAVRFEMEYGQGWYTPEECDRCGGEWTEEPPGEDE